MARETPTIEQPGNLRARFRGALVGVAVGDALGAPFEGVRQVNPAKLDGLLASNTPLRYTDDTHMTLGLAESLLARCGFDGDHLIGTFASHYAADRLARKTASVTHAHPRATEGAALQAVAVVLVLRTSDPATLEPRSLLSDLDPF